MILTGSEIHKQVKLGRIKIAPFSENLINPNSYNYRLGKIIYEVESVILDPKTETRVKKHIITKKGFILRPGKLYLAHTVETIGSDYYVTSLIGRSSVGRLGLFLQITADLGHIGAKHCWTLELKVVQPLRVYPYMKIGQVSFWTPKGSKQKKYIGRYSKYSQPHTSQIHKEF